MTEQTETQPEENIGMATGREDGTLEVMLVARTEDGLRGEAMVVLEKDDPRYQVMVDHLGGINAGESKLIPPFGAPE